MSLKKDMQAQKPGESRRFITVSHPSDHILRSFRVVLRKHSSPWSVRDPEAPQFTLTQPDDLPEKKETKIWSCNFDKQKLKKKTESERSCGDHPFYPSNPSIHPHIKNAFIQVQPHWITYEVSVQLTNKSQLQEVQSEEVHYGVRH